MTPEQALRHDGNLRFYAARGAVICVHSPLARVKICRLEFGRDGSIYVMFPYLRDKRGLLSTLEGEDDAQVTYELAKNGVTVSTDVKFSHHTSGVVRFSKTGEYGRWPRRRSFGLSGGQGRLFVLHCYWLRGFTWQEKPKKNDLALAFNFNNNHPFGLVIEAEWVKRATILSNSLSTPVSIGSHIGPTNYVIHRKTRNIKHVLLFGQPDNYPLQDHVIILTIQEVPIASGADAPTMVFMGGFGPENSVEGSQGQQGCLAFMYPIEGDPTKP